MLKHKVNDPTLAWTPEHLPPGALRFTLPSAVVDELIAGETALAKATAGIPSAGLALGFPLLNAAMTALRASHLDRGYGMVLIGGAQLAGLSARAQASAFLLMAAALGPLQPQNEAQDLTVSVRDENQRMGAGGRYHKSNEGGELHTDGPQYEHPPVYIGLHCLHAAALGGASKMVSAYTIHNVLLDEAPAALAVLYENFHFHQKPGTKTNVAPVFTASQAGDGLCARYLGDYVRSGHRVAETPLSPACREALAVLDTLLADDGRFVLQFDLRPGDILFFDNRRLFHGRSAFRDDPGQPRRELTRVWIG